MLRTTPSTECSMDVSYYDSPLESLNVSDTGETKKKKDLFIHSFIQQISIESLRLTLTELGAGDMCSYPHEAQSLVREGGGHYT